MIIDAVFRENDFHSHHLQITHLNPRMLQIDMQLGEHQLQRRAFPTFYNRLVSPTSLSEEGEEELQAAPLLLDVTDATGPCLSFSVLISS